MERATDRYPEIDLLKGLGCALMLIGHAIRINMPAPDALGKIILHVMDFSGPMFFFASGMNVMTFLERNEHKPGFNAKRFYLNSAVLLFFLGFTYNLNRASLGFMDIFQGVAIGTAGVYLLMRTRIPTWLHFVIATLIYFVYLQFRIRLELDQIVPGFHEMRLSIPQGANVEYFLMNKNIMETMQNMGAGRRWMFLNFSPFAWGVFFYIGALCYRSVVQRKHKTWPWIGLFAFLFVTAPFVLPGLFGRPDGSLLDAVFLSSYLDLTLRGIPSYIMMTLGGAGLAYLLLRRIYHGAAALRSRPGRWLAARTEYLGKESLLFLVAHWWVIDTIFIVQKIINRLLDSTGYTTGEMLPYPRAVLALAITALILPWFARVRDGWRQGSRFGLKMALAIVVPFLLAVPFMIVAPSFGHYLTYICSFAFAFLYPELRGRLRKRYTKPVPTGAPAANAA